MKKQLFIVLLACFTLAMYAHDFKVSGLKYIINEDELTVTIVKSSKKKGELVIPPTVADNNKTYVVTTIAASAFGGCTALTTVNWNARACVDFTEQNHPFRFLNSLKTIVFGNQVKRIPAYLCYMNSALTTVDIPNNVAAIAECAFAACDNLSSVTIANPQALIASNAFERCKNLTSIPGQQH
jgi:hypothetical protein